MDYKNKILLKNLSEADKIASEFNFSWNKEKSVWANVDKSYPMEFDSIKMELYTNVPSMGISNAINSSALAM